MCGICGIAAAERGQKIDPDTLRRMADVIEYRGPDDAGIYVSRAGRPGHAAPEHHRLERGGEPMHNTV
jgi:asparagine synthetase B (glutamine-hydrolysing)